MRMTLDHANYLSFQTFRKSGVGISTPVWFVEDQGNYYVFSANQAGKVKRLRNSPQSKIAPCDSRGRVLGEWIDAEAAFVDSIEEQKHAYHLFGQKYGWQLSLLNFFSRLSGKIKQRTLIVIHPESSSLKGI